ncbi:hypothetical protein SDC9_168463 [bioreactor metagenome]|uniref:Uncharacterized protein n=1 Tax=bioreactor metagenome TaxID=1076179 RepID=A0A645GAJ0_9ZZZZ
MFLGKLLHIPDGPDNLLIGAGQRRKKPENRGDSSSEVDNASGIADFNAERILPHV